MKPKREKPVTLDQGVVAYLRWAESELRRMADACPLTGSPPLTDCVDYAIRAMKIARYEDVLKPEYVLSSKVVKL